MLKGSFESNFYYSKKNEVINGDYTNTNFCLEMEEFLQNEIINNDSTLLYKNFKYIYKEFHDRLLLSRIGGKTLDRIPLSKDGSCSFCEEKICNYYILQMFGTIKNIKEENIKSKFKELLNHSVILQTQLKEDISKETAERIYKDLEEINKKLKAIIYLFEKNTYLKHNLNDLDRMISPLEKDLSGDEKKSKIKFQLELEMLIFELRENEVISSSYESKLKLLPVRLRAEKLYKDLNKIASVAMFAMHDKEAVNYKQLAITAGNISSNYKKARTSGFMYYDNELDNLRKKKLKLMRKTNK